MNTKERRRVRGERERVRTGDGANKQIHPSLQVGGVTGGGCRRAVAYGISGFLTGSVIGFDWIKLRSQYRMSGSRRGKARAPTGRARDFLRHSFERNARTVVAIRLAVARGVELGACIGQTMAPSRWSSAHSPIHFGESEKGVSMTTDSRLERSFEVEHLPRRG